MEKNGFTLIELSIVLVIVGLLVGGVLVGRDLIVMAEARAFMSKATEFETAYNTFRVKYNCMPGDCRNASTLGLGASGTGDRMITYDSIKPAHCSLTPPDAGGSSLHYMYQNGTYGECQLFWVHLSNAGLIAESLNDLTNVVDANSFDKMVDFFPRWGKGYVVPLQYKGSIYLRSGLGYVNDRANWDVTALSGVQMRYIAGKYDLPILCESATRNPDDCPEVFGKKIIAQGFRSTYPLPSFTGLYGEGGTTEDRCANGSAWQDSGKCNIWYRIN